MRAIVQQAVIDATTPCPIKLDYAEWYVSRAKRDARKGHTRSDIELTAAWYWAEQSNRCSITRWGLDSSQARQWLLSNSNYFRRICELGGFDPDYIRDKALRLQANGWMAPQELKLAA